MSDFKIPSEIQLMCRTIKTVYEGDLGYKKDLRGEARYRQNTIAIQACTEDVPIPYEQQIETFYHEMLHWIFNLIERQDLNDDEKLVEMAGKLLTQALITARYE